MLVMDAWFKNQGFLESDMSTIIFNTNTDWGLLW